VPGGVSDVRSERTYSGGWGPGRKTDSGHNPSIGRWPANVALDEEAAVMLDAQSGDFGESHNTGSFIITDSMRCRGSYGPRFQFGLGDSGGASRFFYTAKACRFDRGGRFNTHATVKPRDLLRWLLTLLATPTGGMCLDPFAGSGSTLVVCKALGRTCVGIEIDEESASIAAKRVQAETAGMFDMAGAPQ
jgi:site-specific DNA-methyltransferase (adenine-specific)